MSDKTVITYKRKRSSSQSDLTKARKVDSSEKTEQEMLPKVELDAFDERFDQVSVVTNQTYFILHKDESIMHFVLLVLFSFVYQDSDVSFN